MNIGKKNPFTMLCKYTWTEFIYLVFSLQGCVSSLLDSILETCGTELPNYNHGNRLQVLSRSSTLITVTQLNNLVCLYINIISVCASFCLSVRSSSVCPASGLSFW